MFRLLSVLIPLLLAWGGIEVLFRVRPTALVYLSMRNVVQQQCTWPDPLLQFRNREGYEGVFANREFRTAVRINGEGLRDRSYPYAKPPGRRRILVLGDSFAFGWGVEAEQTAAKVLERRLSDTDVINAGCSGWSTRQERDYLRSEGLRYHPDQVLLLFCPNDPGENDARYRFEGGRLLSAEEGSDLLSRMGRWLSGHSVLWVLGRRVAEKVTHRTGPGAALPDDLWRVEEGLLRELAETCRAHGAALKIAYVPGKKPDGSPEHLPGFEELQAFTAREKIPFLDLLPALEAARAADPVYYRLDDHWTPHGHAAVGAALEELMR